jgi:hypothetical protein
MNRWLSLALVLIAVLAWSCGGPPAAGDSVASSTSNDVAVDEYQASFAFDAPETCDIFVVRRLVATQSHAVEYDVRVRGRDLAIFYQLTPGAPLPIRASVTTAANVPILDMLLSDSTLSVRGATGEEALRVEGYLGPPASPVAGSAPMGGAPPDIQAALEGLACLLPAQTELGFVPAMFLNRAGGAHAGDVSGQAADAPSLVAWQAPVTLLAALWGSAASLSVASDGSLGWSPRCPSAQNPLLGQVTFPCASP